MAMNTGELARELEDLIAALDRRVPRVEQAGEVTIAREARRCGREQSTVWRSSPQLTLRRRSGVTAIPPDHGTTLRVSHRGLAS